MKVQEFFKGMNLKAIIMFIVLPTSLAILIYLIYKIFFKKDVTIQSAEKSTITDLNTKSNSEVEAGLKASALLNAMNRAGTDFKTMIKIFKGLKTSAELKFIIEKFGIKKYFGTGMGDGILTRFMAKELNLIQWIQAECSQNEQEQIRKEFARLGVSFI